MQNEPQNTVSVELEIRAELLKLIGNFASLEPDGTYWGHDTNLGTCQEEIDSAANKINAIVDTARAEGYEQGYNDGHEQQLKMRILDQKELKKGNHAA